MPDAAESPAVSPATAPPAVGVPEAAVLRIARELAREIQPGRRAVERAGLDSSLDEDWGFDSLSRAELLLRIERAFATRLPERLLGEAETLRDLLDALADAKAAPFSLPDVAPRAPAAEPAEPAPDTAATLRVLTDVGMDGICAVKDEADRPWLWVAGCFIGLFVGPVQAASRSLMARLSPPDQQAEYFGLFALSGKATAFVGPIVVAVVTDVSSSQRLGLATIIAFLVAGLVLLQASGHTDSRPRAGTRGDDA